MGNFSKAHAKWWDDNAKETEKHDSKRKKAVMGALSGTFDSDMKNARTPEAKREIMGRIAPQRPLTQEDRDNYNGKSSKTSDGQKGTFDSDMKNARTPEAKREIMGRIAPQRPLTQEDKNYYNGKSSTKKKR